MKATFFTLAAALAVRQAAAHATFQDLWINGVDQGSTCVRLPPSNNPVTDVTSNDIRCNVNGAQGITGKCAVKGGDTVTVEMHQQPGDRSCANEAIGGDHFGPVHVYMSKVSDASSADGSSGWFKVYMDSWSLAGASGSDDNWGTKDMNNCCGKVDVKIPSNIPAGDYLLRAEVIALHVASGVGGAQFYVSCYQLTVSGSGTASPSLVSFPGAYKAQDPGILVNIYESMSTYIDPGPTLFSGGSSKSAGGSCTGYAASETPKTGAPASPTPVKTTAAGGTTLKTTASAGGSTPTGSGGGASCSVAQYGQCGGTGFTGCTTCAAGHTCSAVSPPYYYQCV